jgi:hypothetical protein
VHLKFKKTNVHSSNTTQINEMWVLYGSEYYVPTFWRNVLPLYWIQTCKHMWQILPKCWYLSAKVWGITSLKTTLQLSWLVFDCCVCASHLLVLHCKYTCLKFYCLITACYGLKHSIWVNIYWEKVVYLFKWTYLYFLLKCQYVDALKCRYCVSSLHSF